MTFLDKSSSLENIPMDHERNISLTNLSSTTHRISFQFDLDTALMNYIEYRISKQVIYYGYITEVVVGGVANILVLIIMLGLKHLPICNYMAMLALADLSVLLVSCLLRWPTIESYNIPSLHTVACRILNFQTYWSFSLSAWLLVAMTIDRYIAITYPLKALRLSTTCRARIVIASLMIATAVINCHYFITLVSDQPSSNQKSVCTSYTQYKYFVNTVWPWIDATIYSFLPFTCLIIFNFLIIRSHKKSMNMHSALRQQSSEKSTTTSNQASCRITFTLLTVTFTFIFLTAPNAILFIIRRTTFNFMPTPHQLDFKILAQYLLTDSLVNVLMYANHSVNFFLYVLTGQKFRQQFLRVFKCPSKPWKLRVRSPQTESSSHGVNITSWKGKKVTKNKATDSNENVLQLDQNLQILSQRVSTGSGLSNSQSMSVDHRKLNNQHVPTVSTGFLWNVPEASVGQNTNSDTGI